MATIKQARALLDYIRDWTGRRIMSAPGVQRDLENIGLNVAEEVVEGRPHMAINGAAWIPLFTAGEEAKMLAAEGRGGWVDETPELLVEQLDLAFGLFELCFPDASRPDTARGRGRTMDNIRAAFEEQLQLSDS